MDSNLRALRPYRQALTVSAAGLALMALLGVAASRVGAQAPPLEHALAATVLPAVLLAGAALILSVAALGIPVSLPLAASTLATEEPLLARPRLPAIRRDAACIVVLGVTPGAGASTIAANLAVLVASEGRLPTDPAHHPRPLCLLNRVSGPDRLGLDPAALSSYLAAHPWNVGDEVVELPVRHPSGAEFLACGPGTLNGVELRQTLPLLHRYYNPIIIDAAREDRWMADAAVELADVIFLVSGPEAGPADPVARWLESIWALGYEGKTVLVRNRRRASDPRAAGSGHRFLLELPEDSVVAESEGSGAAWATGKSATARQLRTSARMLLPELMGKGTA